MGLQAYKEKGIRLLAERKKHKFGNKFMGYTQYYDDERIKIYQKPTRTPSIEGSFGDMVVCCDSSRKQIIIYPNYKLKFCYRIKLIDRNFPDLISDSRVDSIQVLPYMREIRPDVFVKALRVIVITEKGQIYHNFPSRATQCEGVSKAGDIFRFEESVVWDIPMRKYPVQHISCNINEVFYPNLPSETYELHPRACNDKRFKDKYGNGGFPAVKYVEKNGERQFLNRFYIPNRQPLANPFHYMGGGEKDYKLNVIATYRPNIDIGARTCVFASTDGGRIWYCKYEFGDYGDYSFKQGHENKYGGNFGNKIINKDYHEILKSADLSIQKRTPLTPAEEHKGDKFRFGALLAISEIVEDEHFTIKTLNKHELSEGNIIVIRASCDEDVEKFWFVNNAANETIVGSGIFFKVHIIDENTVSLYEYVASAENNLCCRHIHHVNKTRDGFLIGTGEIFPNGWLLYLQAKPRDTFSRLSAEEDLDIIRLNTLSSSVQRTMGAIFEERESINLVVASDHDMLNRPMIALENVEGNFNRGSTGIYVGQLNQIDDFSSFKLLVEACEPCFYFDKIDGKYIFCGQRGELIVQTNNGWIRTRIEKTIITFRGNIRNAYIFNDYIILRK